MISNFDKLMKETPFKISQALYRRCDMCYYQPCCDKMRSLTNADENVCCKKGFELFLKMEHGGHSNV